MVIGTTYFIRITDTHSYVESFLVVSTLIRFCSLFQVPCAMVITRSSLATPVHTKAILLILIYHVATGLRKRGKGGKTASTMKLARPIGRWIWRGIMKEERGKPTLSYLMALLIAKDIPRSVMGLILLIFGRIHGLRPLHLNKFQPPKL